MTTFHINGKRLIPAPVIEIQKNYTRANDGTKLGSVYNLTITGTELSFMGAPLTTGQFTNTGYPADEPTDEAGRLANVFRKQEYIREMFAEDGLLLEIIPTNGAPPFSCRCRVISIDYPQDLWVQLFRYSIVLETNQVYVNGTLVDEDNFDDFLDSVDEQWSLEVSDPENENVARTYVLTHNVSAKGQLVFDSVGDVTIQPWERARNYVLPKLGLDNNILMSSGVNNLPSYYGGYNHVRSESIDKAGGSYTVNETWVIASGSAIEDFTVTTSREQGSALRTASIQGEIRGLETRDSNMNLLGSKYYHADVKWNQVQLGLANRVQLYSGVAVNSTPISSTVGTNPVAGTITYSYEYNNRPTHIVSDTLMENITVTHSKNIDVFAEIFILGRTQGPILQNLGTKRAKTVNINIDLVMNFVQNTGDQSLNTLKNYFTLSKPSLLAPYSTQIQSILDANNPLNYGYTTAFVNEYQESWNPSTGSYSLSAGWTYE